MQVNDADDALIAIDHDERSDALLLHQIQGGGGELVGADRFWRLRHALGGREVEDSLCRDAQEVFADRRR